MDTQELLNNIDSFNKIIDSVAESPKMLDTSIPQKLITRNEYGLISNDVEYFYTPEGLIDWRKMINPKYLAVNKVNFEKKGKPIPETIEGLDDRDLLILLPGIKELAQTRGFYSVNYSVTSPSSDCVITVCCIRWMANFETDNTSVEFSAIGDATPFNTTAFGKQFLGPISENRAFVRAVRNFLKINILSQEEMAPNPLSSSSENVDSSSETLALTMAEFGVTFDKIKAKLIEEKQEGAEQWKRIGDIPKVTQFQIIARLKKKKKNDS